MAVDECQHHLSIAFATRPCQLAVPHSDRRGQYPASLLAVGLDNAQAVRIRLRHNLKNQWAVAA